MAKSTQSGHLNPEKAPRRRSRSRTPSRTRKQAAAKVREYTSEGVQDNDVFLLPGSDYRVMILLTVVGAAIRLFRIYQPSSVVFDEVQYVNTSMPF